MNDKVIVEEGLLMFKKYDDGSIEIIPKIIKESETELSETIAALHLMSGYLSLHLNYVSDNTKQNMIDKIQSEMKNGHLKLVIDNDKKSHN